MPEGRDRSKPVTCEMISQAKENLIMRRETHLDQLADKLKEERVRRIIEPMLRGEILGPQVSQDDLWYAIDLGLISRGPEGLQISNEIYREIIPRELTAIVQSNLEAEVRRQWFIQADGRLDLQKLLEAFQQFFREHSESWTEMFDYREAGP